MSSAKFKFIHVPNKTCSFLDKKSNLEYLMKWSMKGHLRVYYYNFNQPFQSYEKQEFAESFFKDPAVYSSLEAVDFDAWLPLNIPATKVCIEQVPCTVTSMEFFDKILDEKNEIVRGHGRIIQCMEELVDEVYITDHLRAMLLDSSHESYGTFSKSEREQFIFLLFQHLCLGGKWCQNEEQIQPYLELTKELYKNLISVERISGEKEIMVRSLVLKTVAYGDDDEPIFPKNPHHPQNSAYLIIDPFKRQVAVLVHQLASVLNE